MMGRHVSGWLGLALGAALVLPAGADAQIRVHVDWEWSSDGRSGGRVYAEGGYGYRAPRVGVVRYQPVRYVRVSGIRIPRGFRPARGMCRLWYPGMSPGRQPRPVRCEYLRGRYHPEVLVVTWRGILRPVWSRYDNIRYGTVPGMDYRWTGERYARDDRYRRDGRWYDGRWVEWDDDDWWDDDDRWENDDRDRVRRGRPGNGKGRGRGKANGRGRGG